MRINEHRGFMEARITLSSIYIWSENSRPSRFIDTQVQSLSAVFVCAVNTNCQPVPVLFYSFRVLVFLSPYNPFYIITVQTPRPIWSYRTNKYVQISTTLLQGLIYLTLIDQVLFRIESILAAKDTQKHDTNV